MCAKVRTTITFVPHEFACPFASKTVINISAGFEPGNVDKHKVEIFTFHSLNHGALETTTYHLKSDIP